jgi:hypothetical protein
MGVIRSGRDRVSAGILYKQTRRHGHRIVTLLWNTKKTITLLNNQQATSVCVLQLPGVVPASMSLASLRMIE